MSIILVQGVKKDTPFRYYKEILRKPKEVAEKEGHTTRAPGQAKTRNRQDEMERQHDCDLTWEALTREVGTGCL